MRIHAVMAIPFAFIGTGAAAQVPITVPVPPTTSAPAKERMVCKTSDTLGSRLKVTKICHTQSEWRQMARDQSENMDSRLRTVHQEASGG